MENRNLPAFPVTLKAGDTFRGIENIDGLTKREYFASIAMQGCLSNMDQAPVTDFAGAARYCVTMADALLAELEKPQP